MLCPGSGGWSSPTPKEARDQDLPGIQLFDLEKDPGERVNCAEENPEVCAVLLQTLVKTIDSGRSTPGEPQENDRAVSF